MIQKQNYNASLYFQEYKKGFAFSTKFHYFSDQKRHILHLKKQFFFQNFFLKFSKKFFSSNLAELWSEKGISKNSKKKFWKKIFFFSHFFFENRNKIAKNRSIKTMVTIPNWQDFEVFRTYWFFWIRTSAT